MSVVACCAVVVSGSAACTPQADDPTTVTGTMSLPGLAVGDPKFIGDLVVVPIDNRFVAYRPPDEQPVWVSEPCDLADWMGWRPDHEAVVVTACDDEIVILDPADGKVRWRTDRPSEGVVADSSRAVAVNDHNGLLEVFDASDGSLLWDFTTGDRATDVDNDRLYIGTGGNVYGADIAGGDTVWLATIDDDWGTGSVGVFDGQLFVVEHDGTRVASFAADSGKLLWVTDLDGDPLEVGVVEGISGGFFIARDNETGRVVALDRETGEEAWSDEGASSTWRGLAVSQDHLVIYFPEIGAAELIGMADPDSDRRVIRDLIAKPDLDDARVAYVRWASDDPGPQLVVAEVGSD